jgi:molybdate transport system ATP-binding protein
MIEIALTKKLNTAQGVIDAVYEMKIEKGEFVTIFGSSGAGKTTLLRLMAGLEHDASGKIVVEGKVWFDSDKKINLSPQERSVGFVFQEYALFPTMSVKENLLFALKKGDDPTIVDEMMELVELGELATRSPYTLSGGQKQRVALARALVSRPQILLLDEPLSALDHTMRVKLQDEIAMIHKKVGISTLLVSHDPSEAVKLSSRLIVIETGAISYNGTPLSYFSPHTTSGKVEMVGEVLSLVDDFPVVIAHILVANKVVQVVITHDEKRKLSVGSKVILSSKGFNSVVLPFSN